MNISLSSKRYEWLDIAKGMAIILMVFGHTPAAHYVSNFIWAFHMPLFFIASGFCTNWRKRSFVDFLRNKTQTILVPFIVYSIIVMSLYATFEKVSIVNWLKFGWTDNALWFIPVFFMSHVVVYIIYKINDKIWFWIMSLAFLSVGIIFNRFDIALPWRMSVVPYATFLLILGTECRGLIRLLVSKQVYYAIPLCLLTYLLSHYFRMDMYYNRIYPVIILTIAACSGTLMIFIISQFLYEKIKFVANILSKIGKETYVIMAFSQILIILQNEFTSLSSIPRYLILVVVLYIITICKNFLNKKIGKNIL